MHLQLPTQQASKQQSNSIYGTVPGQHTSRPACTTYQHNTQRTDEQLRSRSAPRLLTRSRPTSQPAIPSTLPSLNPSTLRPSNPAGAALRRHAPVSSPCPSLPHRPVPEPEPDQALITLGLGLGAGGDGLWVMGYGLYVILRYGMWCHGGARDTDDWAGGSQSIIAIPAPVTGSR